MYVLLIIMSENTFLNSLEWRRAVKHFGEGDVDTEPIMNAIVNAPSSFGLQPYQVVAVRDKEIKSLIQAAAYNQKQITECHTLFVFCARSDISERAEEYLTATGAEAMRDMLMGFISYLPDKSAWAARQTYIALGFALAACAELRISSCPMEGFSSADVKNILKLSDNLQPVVMLAVGASADNDETWPRFRFPKSDLIKE